jgi:uncharacterized protein YdeI (YjbR/CyaY-like superfamily)
MAELPELLVGDAAAWRAWLDANGTESGGVWLVLARKGQPAPTTLTYSAALEEALCYGWIDGQKGPGDAATYRHKFTPRRSRSGWSKRNVGIVARLEQEGRMRPAGRAEVERARADGRWDAAYAGPAAREMPPDLETALAADPAARATWDVLTSANRYAVVYRITTAKRPETRARWVERLVAMLARGETIHPQRPKAPTPPP